MPENYISSKALQSLVEKFRAQVWLGLVRIPLQVPPGPRVLLLCSQTSVQLTVKRYVNSILLNIFRIPMKALDVFSLNWFFRNILGLSLLFLREGNFFFFKNEFI